MILLLILLMIAVVLLLAIVASGIWLVLLTVRARRSKPLPGRPCRSSGDW